MVDGRWTETAAYFQHCRRRRNATVYDQSGVTSAAEARELLDAGRGFLEDVTTWLRAERPALAP